MSEAVLPEVAGVPWRRAETARTLRGRGRIWTAWTLGYAVPFPLMGAAIVLLEPVAAPLAFIAAAHGWVIPELYAFRGALTVKPRTGPSAGEKRARGLLGDLLGHAARDLQRDTGLAVERGELGVWLVGEAGALLVVPGGRRVHCFCVRTTDESLPASDRIAHLLLALRTDEQGFATVANHAFAGAPWRVRRRLRPRVRPALDAALDAARG